MNVAARLCEYCKAVNRRLVMSGDLLHQVTIPGDLRVGGDESIALRGRQGGSTRSSYPLSSPAGLEGSRGAPSSSAATRRRRAAPNWIAWIARDDRTANGRFPPRRCLVPAAIAEKGARPVTGLNLGTTAREVWGWLGKFRLLAQGGAKGGAKPVRLCPRSSDVNLFCYGEGIIDFDAEIPDGALDLCMSQQQLHGT